LRREKPREVLDTELARAVTALRRMWPEADCAARCRRTSSSRRCARRSRRARQLADDEVPPLWRAYRWLRQTQSIARDLIAREVFAKRLGSASASEFVAVLARRGDLRRGAPPNR
jgi:hypothetical protein